MVELVASGYEFVCPNCDTHNRIAGACEEVRCYACREAFEVSDYSHAIDSNGDALAWAHTIGESGKAYAEAVVPYVRLG